MVQNYSQKIKQNNSTPLNLYLFEYKLIQFAGKKSLSYGLTPTHMPINTSVSFSCGNIFFQGCQLSPRYLVPMEEILLR